MHVYDSISSMTRAQPSDQATHSMSGCMGGLMLRCKLLQGRIDMHEEEVSQRTTRGEVRQLHNGARMRGGPTSRASHSASVTRNAQVGATTGLRGPQGGDLRRGGAAERRRGHISLSLSLSLYNIYIYTYIHTNIHTYICMHMCVCIYIYICIRIYDICLYTTISIHICM